MFTLETGSGFWNPIIWCGAIVVSFLIVYILRGFGKKDFKQQTRAKKYAKEQAHVKSGSAYWGFAESLEWAYNIILKIHTGNISDYVLWFVIVLAVLFIMIGVI